MMDAETYWCPTCCADHGPKENCADYAAMRPITEQDVIQAANKSYKGGRKHGQEEEAIKIADLRAQLAACHEAHVNCENDLAACREESQQRKLRAIATIKGRERIEHIQALNLIASALGEPNPPDLSCVRLADKIYQIRQEQEAAVDVLTRLDYRRCDTPACNCGSWHRPDKEEP